MDKHKLQLIAFLTLFAIISVLTYFVFRPFFTIIILAAVGAIITYPTYEKIDGWLPGGKTVAATAVVIGFLIFIIVPMFFLGTQIVKEAQTIYISAQSADYLQNINHSVEDTIRHFSPNFSFDVNNYLIKFLNFIFDNLSSLVSQLAYLIFEIILLLFTFFFFLRKGDQVFALIKSLSPFQEKHNDRFISAISQTIHGVMKGTVLVAIIRWIFLSLAFYLFGIPAAVLWGSVAGIIGAIPGVGTLAGLIPAVAYLFIQGNYYAAIGLACFGFVVVLFVDNWLVTYFLGKGLNVPSIFVLFSIIGGLIYFGPIGFILGPLVLSLFISMIQAYEQLVQDQK